MNQLSNEKCTPCQGGIPPLEKNAVTKLLSKVTGWNLIDDATKLEKSFVFPNFKLALEFVNSVGELAEEHGHHPDIKLGWGYVEIVIYTHKINGLHENDFILAAKIDELEN